jgi:cytochrome c5
VYAVVGGSGDWVKTVIVMSGKERGWISARELEDLATCTFEVASSNPERSRPAPDATSLPSRVAFAQKCSRCHGLGRAYAVICDPVQWVKTVVTMSGKDLGWISSDTMRTVIRYRQRHSDYVERLFDSSCGACHRLDELQAAQRGKTDSQWRTTVNYMSRRCVAGMEGHEREALFYALVGAR